MKDYMDFMLDVVSSPQLGNDLVVELKAAENLQDQKGATDSIADWFGNQKYAVSSDEVVKIRKHYDAVKNLQPGGGPIPMY